MSSVVVVGVGVGVGVGVVVVAAVVIIIVAVVVAIVVVVGFWLMHASQEVGRLDRCLTVHAVPLQIAGWASPGFDF